MTISMIPSMTVSLQPNVMKGCKINSNRSRMSCPPLVTRLVKRLWTGFIKKMSNREETSIRPCAKYAKEIPNVAWINLKICKRLHFVACSYITAFNKFCVLLQNIINKIYRYIIYPSINEFKKTRRNEGFHKIITTHNVMFK